MELRLDNKVALITGSDSGIGRGIAVRFAESGADVMVTYYSDRPGAEETAAMVEALGRKAAIVQGDVGDPVAVERIYAAFDSAFDRIDILVNNAGVGAPGEIVDTTFESWERVIRTNLHGPFLMLQQAARRMIARGEGGRIINISSVHEEAASPTGASYNASKGGLRNLTRTAAIELGRYGITVNDIAPGLILTPMNYLVSQFPDRLRAAEEQIVMGRAGLPVDIANMACYLASDAASYSTGSTHFVDGGWMLTWPPV
ncbi:MAG: SDR family oxidoreductase [Thermomicrobiales bacterium]